MTYAVKKCVCGRRAVLRSSLIDGGASYIAPYVNCSRPDCWIGPVRKTNSGAISAWNRVMGNLRPDSKVKK